MMEYMASKREIRFIDVLYDAIDDSLTYVIIHYYDKSTETYKIKEIKKEHQEYIKHCFQNDKVKTIYDANGRGHMIFCKEMSGIIRDS